MTFPRFFSPSVSSRLFDPMPLPRSVRLKRAGKIKAKLPKTSTFKSGPTRWVMARRLSSVNFRIKKIPVNR